MPKFFISLLKSYYKLYAINLMVIKANVRFINFPICENLPWTAWCYIVATDQRILNKKKVIT